MAKGAGYERDVCKRLSLWWTDGANDAVFWRSSQSGGRATTRSKKGKETKGQHGDLAATDPIGQPFVDLFTVEMKRGYKDAHVGGLIDRPEQASQQPFEKFLDQVLTSHENEKTWAWLLIHKRDRREEMVYYPFIVSRIALLPEVGEFRYTIRREKHLPYDLTFAACSLKGFLDTITADDIKDIAQRRRLKKKVRKKRRRR